MRPGSSYLSTTLQSLFNSSTVEDRHGVLIVVLLCDQNATNRANILSLIKTNFSEYVKEGSLQVIERELFPEAQIYRQTYNDTLARVQWRTKQVMDFVFLLRYSQNLSQYFLQLEDDVVASPDFIPAVKEFIDLQGGDWIDLQFSSFLAIGRLYKNEFLPKLASFLSTFCQEQPVDILFEYFRSLMVPTLGGEKVVRRPALFQHVGKVSSLADKIQNLTDKSYGTATREYNGDNPPAAVFTNIATFQSYHLTLAYAKAPGFFWGSDVKKGDEIHIIFKNPTLLSRVVVATGNKDRPKDMLYNSKMDACTKVQSVKGNKVVCDDFSYVGSFDDGLLDIPDFYAIFPYYVQCLRITVLSNQEPWLIIREIAVFVKPDVHS